MADPQQLRGRAPARSPAGLFGTAEEIKARLDRSPLAKHIVGAIADQQAQYAGFARGGLQTIRDTAKAAYFLSRLNNPFDDFMSPPGQSAHDQVRGAGKVSINYGKRVAADPNVALNDVKAAARKFRQNTDPTASPMADTLSEEIQRRLQIGMNKGEAGFDVISLFAGGPAVKGLGKFPVAVEALAAAQAARASRTPRQIARLDELYDGEGSHWAAKRFTKGLPEFVRSNPFTVYRPPISREDFYVRHAQLDSNYFGGPLPDGGGWSSKDLGVGKLGLFDSLSYGMPAPTRAVLLANTGSAGGSLFDFAEEDELR
jgi:hypothetical protein